MWNRKTTRIDHDLSATVARRREMVERQIKDRGLKHPETLRAMAALPRHRFVPRELAHEAYSDRALPIGMGQTISQPFMVAIMTAALSPHPGLRVLEIGTGSGYQAALLAFMGCEVWTVERIPQLALAAQSRIHSLGFSTVRFRVADGSMGWPTKSPFGAILVTAGAPGVPESLKTQLADGGRLVIPTGTWTLQELMVVDRTGDTFEETRGGPCAFVPLIGEEGWNT